MSQILEEQLSAILDGELPAEEVDLLLARMDREPDRRATLGRYAMIGECLRSGAARPEALCVAERVRTALLADDAGKAPTSPATRGFSRTWLAGGAAAAAAAAALAFLIAGPAAWRTNAPADAAVVQVAATDLLNEPLTGITTMANRRLNPRAAARLTGYLVAHGEYTNELSRNTFDSHLVSARAERASWRQPQDANDAR